MNEVERFLDRVCCGVGGSSELRRHLRRELQEHLTAEIEANVAAGMEQQEAVQSAIEAFGDPVMHVNFALLSLVQWGYDSLYTI